jgi:hypothetical protein
MQTGSSWWLLALGPITVACLLVFLRVSSWRIWMAPYFLTTAIGIYEYKANSLFNALGITTALLFLVAAAHYESSH